LGSANSVIYRTFSYEKDGGIYMSLSMQKMWISILGMFLLALAMLIIYISRYKLKNGVLKVLTSITAWILLVVGGLMCLLIVFTGPTS
jgi:vacuolar-type H+-ATPase subunit I/STV1